MMNTNRCRILHASFWALLFLLAAPSSSWAGLFDRGGGLLYDDVLDVTWLQDANYAKTSGFDPDGHMSWDRAQSWTHGLVYFDSVRGINYSDWRLPRINPINGVEHNGKFSFNGSSDEGYNISSPASELGYMFYVNLGLKGYYDKNGMTRNDFGIFGNGTYGTRNLGPVINLQSVIYWSGTSQVEHPTLNAWMFDPYWGYQNFYSKWDHLSAWALRDGDVGSFASTQRSMILSVPEPESSMMLISGLMAVLLVKNRRKKRSVALCS